MPSLHTNFHFQAMKMLLPNWSLQGNKMISYLPLLVKMDISDFGKSQAISNKLNFIKMYILFFRKAKCFSRLFSYPINALSQVSVGLNLEGFCSWLLLLWIAQSASGVALVKHGQLIVVWDSFWEIKTPTLMSLQTHRFNIY